jgi:hypothetical protein
MWKKGRAAAITDGRLKEAGSYEGFISDEQSDNSFFHFSEFWMWRKQDFEF